MDDWMWLEPTTDMACQAIEIKQYVTQVYI